MTQSEKEQILKARKNGLKLSDELRLKLLDSVNKGEPSIFQDDKDDICCDLGVDPPDRYKSCSEDTCKALGGTVVSDSYCKTLAGNENRIFINGSFHHDKAGRLRQDAFDEGAFVNINDTCTGNACDVIEVTSHPSGQGFLFSNLSKKKVNVAIRVYYGVCSDPSDNIIDGGKSLWLRNGGFCSYTANYA